MRPWRSIIQNPVDLPDLQVKMGVALGNAWGDFCDGDFDMGSKKHSEYAKNFVSVMASLSTDPNVGGVKFDTSVYLVLESLLDGGSFFVVNEMTSMLHRVARNVPEEFTMHPRIFPTDRGFLFLEEPFIFAGHAICGWSWSLSWVTSRDVELNLDVEEDGSRETMEEVIERMNLVTRTNKDGELECCFLTFALWDDVSHEDDRSLTKRVALGEDFHGHHIEGGKEMFNKIINQPNRQDPKWQEGALKRYYATQSLGRYNPAPVCQLVTTIPAGCELRHYLYTAIIDNESEGLVPYEGAIEESRKAIDESLGRKNTSGMIGYTMEFIPPSKSAELWKFIVATHEMLSSRIVSNRHPSRAEQRQLARLNHNKEFRIIRLRKVIHPSQNDHDYGEDYRIDYRYMVPPHWQRYHTKEGVVWKMRDWYVAGPDDAPLLERDTVYQLDR